MTPDGDRMSSLPPAIRWIVWCQQKQPIDRPFRRWIPLGANSGAPRLARPASEPDPSVVMRATCIRGAPLPACGLRCHGDFRPQRKRTREHVSVGGATRGATEACGRRTARNGAHESARRNWWEDRWSMRTGSEQVRSRYAPPRSLARRPCGRRTRFLGPSRGSLPGAAWRFAPAPSGKTKCTGRGRAATTALSTNFGRMLLGLSPNFHRMWTTCGWRALQRACNIRRVTGRRRFW